MRLKTHLSLPILPQERLVARAERRARSSQARARAHSRGASVAPVVACPHSATIEVRGAVRRCGRPLANDGPQVKGRKRGAIGAGRVYMLLVGAADLVLREHLIDMSVHRNALPVRCRLEAAPVARGCSSEMYAEEVRR